MRTIVFISFIFLICDCNAQKNLREMKLKSDEKKEIIEQVNLLLRENYVFQTRADSIAERLYAKFSTHGYDTLDNLDNFGDALNADLAAFSRDKHVQVNFSPKIVRQIRADASKPDEGYVKMLRQDNFRMRKVELLHGNIGYFKLDYFAELRFCKEELTGAMTFISNASAIVLDLSDCGGGAAETMNYILSYFFPDSTKLGELRLRKNNEVKINYATKDAAIRKLLDVPLFVLVSHNTASAAEGLAACLQEYRRALIVGNQTKGLANPGELFAINDMLYMFVTTAVSGTGKSGTNFDGVGIKPDVMVGASTAFNYDKAMEEVCRRIGEQSKTKELRNAGAWLVFEYQSRQSNEYADSEFLTSIAGPYEGGRHIINENGFTYFTMGTTKRKMKYMGRRTFGVEGRPDYRIVFPNDKKISKMKVLWFDDTDDTFDRTD